MSIGTLVPFPKQNLMILIDGLTSCQVQLIFERTNLYADLGDWVWDLGRALLTEKL